MPAASRLDGSEIRHLLHGILLETTRSLKADASQCVLYDAASDALVSEALTEEGRIVPHPEGFPMRIRATGSGCFEVLRDHRTPRRFDPVTEPELFWPGTLDYHRKFCSQAVYAVPLHFGERFAGFLGLAFRRNYLPSADELPVIEALARQAGVAAELVRLGEIEKQACIAKEREGAARALASASERRALMLGEIAVASRDLQDADDFEAGLGAWLERVAGCAGADAAGLGDYRQAGPGQRVVPRIRAAWTSRSGATPVAPVTGPEEVPETQDFEEWTARILRDETVWATRSDLRDPASRRYWDAEGCAGHVLVPVHLFGHERGFLSFDFFTERSYDPELVGAIQTAAAGLSAALRRYAMHQAQIAERDAYAAQVTRANDALQATINAVTNLQTLDQFMPRVLGIITANFEAVCAGYFEYPNQELIYHRYWMYQGRQLSATELPDLDPRYLPVMQWLADGFTVSPEHLGVATGKRVRPSIIHHRTATASPVLHAFCLSRGWHWELNVPLFANGRNDAAFTLYRPEGSPFTEADVSLAVSLANQLSLARQVSRVGELERESALLRQREQTAIQRVETIRRIANGGRALLARLANQPELDAFLGHVLTVAAEQFGAVGGAIWQPTDQGRAQLVLSLEGGVARKPDATDHPGTQAGSDPDTADTPRVQRGEIVVSNWETIRASRHFSAYVGWLESRGIRTVMTVPMFLGESYRGSLTLRFTGDRRLEPEEMELAHSLANHAVLALEMSRLAEEGRAAAIVREQKRAAETRGAELAKANEALRRSTAQLVGHDNLSRYLDAVLVEAVAAAGAVSGATFVLSADANHLSLAAMVLRGEVLSVADDPRAATFRQPTPVTDNRTWEVMSSRREAFWIDYAWPQDRDWPPSRAWHDQHGHRHVVCLPMETGQSVIGCFGLAFDRSLELPPAPNRLELCAVLAQQAALAIRLTNLADAASRAASIQAVQQERLRIAAEMHDSLAQSFTSIALQSEALSARPEADAVTAAVMRTIEQTARQGLAEVRASVLTLHSLDGPPGTLDIALAQLAMRCDVPGSIRCSFVSSGEPCELLAEERNSLIRIAREALNNAMRHSGGTQIRLGLRYADGRLQMSIDDDGKGLPDSGRNGRSGYGLEGMARRAREIGATLKYMTSELGGARVQVELGCSPARATEWEG